MNTEYPIDHPLYSPENYKKGFDRDAENIFNVFKKGEENFPDNPFDVMSYLKYEMYDPEYALHIHLNGNGTCYDENIMLYKKLFKKQLDGEIGHLTLMKVIFDCRSEDITKFNYIRHYLCVYMRKGLLWIEDCSNGFHKRMPYMRWASFQRLDLVQKMRVDEVKRIKGKYTIEFKSIPDIAEIGNKKIYEKIKKRSCEEDYERMIASQKKKQL